MTTEPDRSQRLLDELLEEGEYIPKRSSAQRAWVEANFARLQLLVDSYKQPFSKIATKVKSEITMSPSTLRKQYYAVKESEIAKDKERKRASRQAKRLQQSEANGNGTRKQSRAKVKPPEVDLSKITPPPPLVHVEVVED